MSDNKIKINYICERCVSCGAEIPEGRMICQNCENTIYRGDANVLIKDLHIPQK